MSIQFERQQFQHDCVNNIMAILEDVKDNDLPLDKALKKHISAHNIPIKEQHNSNKIDILMETGTGKTYTYIKTIFEMYKRFGDTKFIIVVPRSAIRLGIKQNIRMTQQHFKDEYGEVLQVIDYPADGVNKIESDFLKSDRLTVLIMTSSAFNKQDNKINRMPENGSLFINGTLWENIAKQKPTVIIDEPHLLKGESTQKSFNSLKNSIFIRFGATYPTEKIKKSALNHSNIKKGIGLSNVAYTLDSILAFNQYLVKKIRVNTVFEQGETGGYIVSILNSKYFFLTYFENDEAKKTTVKLGEDIGANTPFLKGITATKIDVTEKKIYLSNGDILETGKDFTLTESEQRGMIRQTIKKHFAKEQRLFEQGIKTLSLFFIPNVSDFRGDNPVIKTIFEDEYKKQRNEIYTTTTNADYKKYLDNDYTDGKLTVADGYFSGDKGAKDAKESDGIDLILNKKEELLSFKAPLRFVFSVWALQEGWDNPNIFNICKLSKTEQETSRRQQVGRGLRLAVNQSGRRITHTYSENNDDKFYNVNTLDMVVSSYELDFINQIQQEIFSNSFIASETDLKQSDVSVKGLSQRSTGNLFGTLEDENILKYDKATDTYNTLSPVYDFLRKNRDSFPKLDDEDYETALRIFTPIRNNVENGNKPKHKVGIRKEQMEKLQELWETINQKSKLVFKGINEENIIKHICEQFDKEQINPIKIKTVEQEYNSHTNEIQQKKTTTGADVEYFKKTGFKDFVNTFTKDLKIPLSFTIKLLNAIDKEKIYNNPKLAKQILKELIVECTHGSVLRDVEYELLGNTEITALQNQDGTYLQEIEYTKIGSKISPQSAKRQSLYDAVVYDSNIEERMQTNEFSENINGNEITVFAKLPKITIPTPFKTYNPDFAFLIEKADGKQLFLVVETKGYDKAGDIKPIEQQKIDYAGKFFDTLQQHLPNVQIAFKRYINTTDLAQILQEIETETKTQNIEKGA